MGLSEALGGVGDHGQTTQHTRNPWTVHFKWGLLCHMNYISVNNSERKFTQQDIAPGQKKFIRHAEKQRNTTHNEEKRNNQLKPAKNLNRIRIKRQKTITGAGVILQW